MYWYDVDSGKSADQKRAYLKDSSPRNITLQAGQEKCVEQEILMKVSCETIAELFPVLFRLTAFRR